MKNLSLALYAVMSIGAWSGVAVAADWPTGPVTIIVPYTPGNITDIAARVLAQKLSDRTGKSFIVENKPGASTQIGTDLVARARGDAHTLLLTGAVFATNPALFSKLPYDSAKDIAPVGLVVSNPLVFVTAEQKPFADFSSFVTYAKSNPGAASVASGGSGTLSHMAMALMAITTDTNVVHVPYKGGSAAAIDTLTGQVDGMWDNPSSAIPQISAGRIRALAVSGIERNPALASVPTVAEQGYKDFEVINWFGLFAPATVPPQLLDAIHDQVQAVLETLEVKERFAKDGVTAGGPSRAEFAAFVADETKRWGTIIEKNNIRAD